MFIKYFYVTIIKLSNTLVINNSFGFSFIAVRISQLAYEYICHIRYRNNFKQSVDRFSIG